MSRLTKERTKVSVERTHLRGEKKRLKFLSLSLSLTLSFEEDEEKKGTNRDGVVPVARSCISLTLSFVFDIERERTLRRGERKKTNKISPQRNKGKEEISLGHPKKKKKKKKKRTHE